MTTLPVFGAGIWHFATYKDRYATEGYGPPVGLLEQIDKAGAVGDLSPSPRRSTTATTSRDPSPTRTRGYASRRSHC
jgi:hypothetical protein